MSVLAIPTAEVFSPLLQPARRKGAFGGRGSGKSHFFADMMVEDCLRNPGLSAVCIREVQRSLRHSSKKLIEEKIIGHNVQSYFEIQHEQIRTPGGGVIIFTGMKDHTAASIKSLENFRRAWVDEAQALSARSMALLKPTIRATGSEMWFSWNPESPEDPVDQYLRGDEMPDDAIVVQANWRDNPWLTDESRQERADCLRLTPDDYDWIWEGDYLTISDAQVLAGKCEVAEFEPQDDWDGPYYGLDFGYAMDPTAAVEVWIGGNRLWVRREAGRVKLDLDDTADCLVDAMPGIDRHVVHADNARPESISYLKRHGLPRCQAVTKWPGSVEDGIAWLKSHEKIRLSFQKVCEGDLIARKPAL